MVASVLVKPSETIVVSDATSRSEQANTPPHYLLDTPVPAVKPSAYAAPVAAGGRRFLCLPRWEAGTTD